MSLRLVHVGLLAVAAACLLPSPAHAVTIDWVTVGDPGNANDWTGFGAVGYEYKIGKYDVTIRQYTDFLNAVAKSDPYSLYSTSMTSNLNIAGISRSGTSGGYTYSVIGFGDKPITYVSWFDAARFANWMQNGQGLGSTETGAYTFVGGQKSGNAVARNPGATFYIPTENEWYKAAYYSPVKGGVGSPGYYSSATQDDSQPGNEVGPRPNQANFVTTPSYTYSVTQAVNYDPNQNYLTPVGAFTNSASYYGTFDQSGNVCQWNDLDGSANASRGRRGGYWGSYAFDLSSSSSYLDAPVFQYYDTGFRLASPVAVPEPSTFASLAAGCAFGCWQIVRRRIAR